MKLKGRLCVYRDGSLKEHLSCDIKTEINGETKTLYWDRVPKCFDIVNGTKNVVNIEFEINDNLKYPRNVVIIGDPF